MMSADQWHRYRAVLGGRNNRRLLLLGAEEGGDRADQYAASADPDDWVNRFEQLADMGRRPIVALVPVAGKGARAVRPSAAPPRPSTTTAMSSGSNPTILRKLPISRMYPSGPAS